MIRYPITLPDLISLIDAEKPDWRRRADARTEEFRAKGRYEESSPIWSEVKPVYMRLQAFKCAYCEREMERLEVGKVDHDVEHFRPKGNVKPWKAPKKLKDQKIEFTVPADGKGYHLLPYSLLNYAAACKPCNSTLKKDYFPIRGKYHLLAEDPTTLKSERQYLIFPIGQIDDDPESLIEFIGTSPRPVAKSGHRRNRALVTIEFFKLDDPVKRKHLYRDRAMLILALYSFLRQTDDSDAGKRHAAETALKGFLRPELRHLNCARSFERLFRSDRQAADEIFSAAADFLSSIS